MPSTIQVFNQTVSDFKLIQDRLFQNQSKIGADSKFETFAEMDNDLTVVQTFESSIQRSERFITSLNTVKRRLDVVDTSISNIIDTAVNFKSSLILENSTTNSLVNDLSSLADDTLDIISGSLNERINSNYVFAGSKTNTQPVSDLKTVNSVVSGEVTANYYNGDEFKAAVDVSRSLRIEYGITASDPAFQNLIGAINNAKAAEISGKPSDLNQAGEQLDAAIEEVISLRAKVGGNLQSIEQSIEIQDKARVNFEQKLAEIKEPNIVDLTIQTSADTAALTAVFQSFSRISNLSLVNFIN